MFLATYWLIHRKQIDKKVKKSQENKPVSKIPLSDEIVEIFEKWRRGER